MSLLFDRPPESVCMIRLSAIGDCCHALPVARTLQAAWPETPLTWIIGKTEHALLNGASGIEFIIFDKRQGWRGLRDLKRCLGGRRFPLLLHMHASMRANLVSTVVRADIRLGYDRARARDFQWLFCNHRIGATPRQHVMDAMFGFTDTLGLDRRIMRWDIPATDADRSHAREVCGTGRPVCVISPCTGQRFRNYRNWHWDNYAAVTRHLHDRHGARIILTGSDTEVERRYGAEIERRAPGPVVNLIGATTLKQLLEIIRYSDLVICPDSGPAHMATAVDTPVIGLYATSNRWRTGPYRSQSLVVDAYPEAVRREFGKPVEALRWGVRVRDPQAMELIRVADVIDRIDRVLSHP